jgi:protein-tyrosine phosphatase
MAEVVLREELDRAGLAGLVEVDSAGTGDWHVGGPMDRRARAELARRGYDGSAHRARQFQPSWFADRDLVLAMDHSNLEDLREMVPDGDADGLRLLLFRSFDPALAGPDGPDGLAVADPYQGAVPDPYGGDTADYALALDLVQAAVRGLTRRLAELLEVPAGGTGSG